MSHKLPKLVCSLTHNFDAWIVGSAADIKNSSPRDYDVIVPFSQWGPASQMIPPDAKPNTFGGWKCMSEGVEVDVWPGELGWLMAKPKSKYVWHPATNTRYARYSEDVKECL
jgi:hypothetical protein